MTRSAIVNDTTYVVENIIVADPINPSPFAGSFMVGLKDPIYEQKTTTITSQIPSGSTYVINEDTSVTVTLPDGTIQEFPEKTIIIINEDGSLTATYSITQDVEVSSGTPCDIGWIYDPATKTFFAP